MVFDQWSRVRMIPFLMEGGVVRSIVDISVCICWFLYTVVRVVWLCGLRVTSTSRKGVYCLLYLHSVFDRGSEAWVAGILGHVVR